MKTYIVQLDDHDDVISAKDKISWSKARRILLVWPRKGHVLEQRVDLLLLQRHCRQMGGQLALVSRSSAVRDYAGDLGIPLFSDVEEAQETSWRRASRRRRVSWHNETDPERKATDPHALREQRILLAQGLNGQSTQPEDLAYRIAHHRGVELGAFTLAILAFLLLALVFAPGAVVELKPARRTQQLTIAVWASPEITSPSVSGGLPAQMMTAAVEGRDHASSTGQAAIPERYATGQVLLSNLTDQVVDVPLGSVLVAVSTPSFAYKPSTVTNESGAVHFLTTQAAHVPAGVTKSVMVSIRAELPGIAGNLAAGKIQALEGLNGARLAVSNPAPTSGGTDRTGTAPNSQDYHALREKLLAALKENALADIKTQLRPDQRVLEGTIRIHSVLEERREPPEGQPGDQLQIDLRVEFEALTVNEADLQAVALAALAANQETGFQPAPGSLKITFASSPKLDEASVMNPAQRNPSVDSGAGSGTTALHGLTARWNIKAERVLEAGWGKEAAIRMIQGRSIATARRVLQSNLRLVESPKIQLYPGWWRWLPFLPARIVVVSQ